MLLLLLVALVAVPIGEIWLLFAVGDQIGALATIGLVILTALLGSGIIRWQGLGVIAQARSALAGAQGGPGPQGQPGADVSNTLIGAAIDGVFLLVAGALLLTPGFVTDTIGFGLLIPPLRHAIARSIFRRVKLSGWTTSSNGAYGSAGPATIDAEFHEIDDLDDETAISDETSPWNPGRDGPDDKSDPK